MTNTEEMQGPWRPEELDITLPNGHVYRFRRPPTRAITEMGLIVLPSKMGQPVGGASEAIPEGVQRARYEQELRANDAMRAFFRRYCVHPQIVEDGGEITDPVNQVAFDRPPAEGDEDLLFEPIMQAFFRLRGEEQSDVPPKPGSVGS